MMRARNLFSRRLTWVKGKPLRALLLVVLGAMAALAVYMPITSFMAVDVQRSINYNWDKQALKLFEIRSPV